MAAVLDTPLQLGLSTKSDKFLMLIGYRCGPKVNGVIVKRLDLSD